ncbi:MAG: THUMP domain-containing protein [Candidatus Hodarchaeales archaeon]
MINKHVILVRIGGELGIKSRQTRRRMVWHLKHNIERFLKQYPIFKILDFRDRLLIYSESNSDLNELAHLIAISVSGISSVSPALVIKATEDSIISGGLSSAVSIIQPHSSFAVRVNREGNHPFSSMDIARKLGAEILSSQLRGIKVDLETPDFQVFLDIRGSLAFVYTEIYKGIDGIPTQSQGVAIALIRPNFNSVVAAWLMKKRGVEVIPVFFKTGKSSEEDFLSQVKSQFSKKIIIVSIKELLNSFKNHSSLCLLCQAYCEQVCQQVAGEQQISTIISPTSFNYNNETMSLEALKILKQYAQLSIMRPIQLGFFSQRLLIDQLDQITCCHFQSEVSIQIFDDFNETILENVLSFELKI